MPQRTTISTHVLDTASGQPAAGVAVSLLRIAAGAETLVGDAVTDDDGRIGDLLVVCGAPAELTAGTYRLSFAVGAYRRARGEGDAFFERVSLDVTISDSTRSYHVPLLLAPFGCTSYRGS